MAPADGPPGAVLLEKRPQHVGAAPSTATQQAEARLEIVADRPGLLAIDTTRRSARVLLVNDLFARGWSCTISGRPAPILRADYVFRAVELPAGGARVELRYVPPGLAKGLIASAAALAIVLAVLFSGLLRRKFRRPT